MWFKLVRAWIRLAWRLVIRKGTGGASGTRRSAMAARRNRFLEPFLARANVGVLGVRPIEETKPDAGVDQVLHQS